MLAKRLGLVSLVSGVLWATPAEAHKPIFSDGSAQNADSAISIDDINVSYAVYHEVTSEADRLWLSFDASAGQLVYAQLGVPFLSRLEDFRPAVALLGPGLPSLELPFEIPEGLGGVLLATDDVTEPEFFNEHFTGTQSWILGHFETSLVQDGRHYLVAYVPNGDIGKLWVAPGRAEVFGLEDILSFAGIVQQVREFHEVAGPGPPCFLPVLAIGFCLYGGLRLAKRKKTHLPPNRYAKTKRTATAR